MGFVLSTKVFETHKAILFEKQRLLDIKADMGVDLSEAKPKVVRAGCKYLKLCSHLEMKELIGYAHQEAEEVQIEETHGLNRILIEINLHKKLV